MLWTRFFAFLRVLQVKSIADLKYNPFYIQLFSFCPKGKSIFAIEIRCDKKYKAISNMPLKASSLAPDDGKDNTR